MTRQRLLRVMVVTVALAPVLVQFDMGSHARAADGVAAAVRIHATSRWARPSTDPGGLTYLPGIDALVVCDSEVEETRRYEGANVWIVNRKGRVRRSFSVVRYTTEPTDVAARRAKGPWFFTDDGKDRVVIVRAGPDGKIGTSDDQLRSFSTSRFGSRDPEGLAWGAGGLFITDGTNRKVYRVRPGPDHRFDGVAPGGDDVVTSFGAGPLGLRDPEDVAFDPASQRLVLIGRHDQKIVEATLNGDLVASYDISGSGIRFPGGVALAPGTDDPTVMHVFVADRGVDNNPEQGGGARPGENDGRIFEFALP